LFLECEGWETVKESGTYLAVGVDILQPNKPQFRLAVEALVDHLVTVTEACKAALLKCSFE
jgi:hypothetical protein